MNIDWALLWDMGGHGAYVWTGWGVALLALGGEFFALWRRSRRLPPPGPPGPAASRESRATPGQPREPRR